MYINLQKRSVFRKKIVDGPQDLLACLKSGNFRVFFKRVGRYLKGATFVVLFFYLSLIIRIIFALLRNSKTVRNLQRVFVKIKINLVYLVK